MGRRRPFTLPILALLVASVVMTPVTSMDLVNGTLGYPVYFTIPVPLPSQYRVDWNCGHAGTVAVIARLPGSGSSPQYNPVYTGRCELLGNGTLRLSNVSYEDEGTYNVKVFNPDTFTSYIQRYQLAIYAILGAPVLYSKSPLVSGTNVTLHCDAWNQNVTTYTFYRGEKMICSEPHVTCRGPYVDLTPITESDSGNYACCIQNPVSSSTSDPLSLTVSVPVSSVTLTSNISGLVWPGKDLVSLQCSARGTDVSYSWTLGGEPLPEDPRYQRSQDNTNLIINPISSNDTKSLRCTALNWVNIETSNKLDVHLASPISAVVLASNTSGVLWEGQDSVSLYCSAQGSDINFSWSLNGNPVSSNPPYYITGGDSPPASTLTISPVSRSDAGSFTCTAANRLNSQSSPEISLNVNWYPEGNIACTAQGHNSMLQFTCSWPGGRPAANVTMIFNNVIERRQHEVTRNVSVQQIAHSSNLTCIGEYFGETFSCALIFGTSQDKNNPITIMEGERTKSKS